MKGEELTVRIETCGLERNAVGGASPGRLERHIDVLVERVLHAEIKLPAETAVLRIEAIADLLAVALAALNHRAICLIRPSHQVGRDELEVLARPELDVRVDVPRVVDTTLRGQAAGISGGSASISGNFTAEEARELEVQLRGGSLPLPVEIIEVRTIGPTLGAENIRRSLVAALSGLAFVAVFMVLAYRLPGAVAVVALSLYALFNLAMYALIPVTLTLPGIAGFILSIGMAVDANVLIFERIKDELRRGNTLIRSIDTGFSEAFSSIVDGHLTTLISCAALFFLGTGLVKGFAATLGIGVLLSLFTALTCTRTLLRFLMGYSGLRSPNNFLPNSQLPTPSA